MVNYVFFVDFAMPVSVLVHFQEMMRRNQNNIVFIIQLPSNKKTVGQCKITHFVKAAEIKLKYSCALTISRERGLIRLSLFFSLVPSITKQGRPAGSNMGP